MSFALHDIPLEVLEGLTDEMVRVTGRGGTIVVVDYDLPRNKAMRFVAYNSIKFIESSYYPGFIGYSLEDSLERRNVEIESELSVLRGIGRILKGKRR